LRWPWGIGATTAIFSVLYSMLLAPLPYVDSERIVMVWSHQKRERNGTSPSDYLDWQKQCKVFESSRSSTNRMVFPSRTRIALGSE
jgi:putative ABC transport system permease protein